jgi:two-component system, NtrC family, response regulator HydG
VNTHSRTFSTPLPLAENVENSTTWETRHEHLKQFIEPMFDAPYLWKGTDRVMILYRSSFATCCGELLRLMPAELVNKTLYPVGYEAGSRSAEFILERTGTTKLTERIRQCLMYSDFCGFTSFELKELNVDLARSQFHCVVSMTSSIEADGYLLNPPSGPRRRVCVMQAGYLSGAVTRLSGLSIRFEETACRGEYAERCELVGSPDLPSVGNRSKAYRTHDSAGSEARLGKKTKFQHADVEVHSETDFAGDSPALRSLWLRLRRIAGTRVPILIYGETGVGKELVARNAQKLSDRSDKPFVAVNCGALPESLIDAELFGVEKGAFTGAIQSRPGKFERAHTGTLFLDEIGLLSPTSQGRLLRVLEDGTFDRLGGHTEHVDVRLIAATNIDLAAAVEKKEFRIDLYYRLCAITLYVPPLRERKEDILPIAYFVLRGLEKELRSHWKGFSIQVEKALLLHDYPGNVRELRQIVTAAASFTEEGDTIDMSALSASGIKLSTSQMQRTPANLLGEDPRVIANRMLANGLDIKEFEQTCIVQALETAGGNLSRAARLLGLTRRQLEYRVKGA